MCQPWLLKKKNRDPKCSPEPQQLFFLLPLQCVGLSANFYLELSPRGRDGVFMFDIIDGDKKECDVVMGVVT